MPPIQLEFTYTAALFSKTQRQVLWNYYSSGWVKWVFMLVGIIWVVKLVVEVQFWYTALIMLLAGGLWWLLFRWLMKRNFSKFPALQHPIQYTFREEDIAINAHNTQTVLQWAAFQRATESKEFFLLFQNSITANPVLKSGFQSETDLERFRELLRLKGLMK